MRILNNLKMLSGFIEVTVLENLSEFSSIQLVKKLIFFANESKIDFKIIETNLENNSFKMNVEIGDYMDIFRIFGEIKKDLTCECNFENPKINRFNNRLLTAIDIEKYLQRCKEYRLSYVKNIFFIGNNGSIIFSNQ
jgi:hypothetical protein